MDTSWVLNLLSHNGNPSSSSFKTQLRFVCSKRSSLEFLLWLSRLRTRHSIHEDAGSIPGLTQWVKDLSGIAVNCGVVRGGLDPELL